MKASWNARSYKAVTRSPTDGELFQIESHVVVAARVTHPSKSRGDDDCRRDPTPRYLDVAAAAADFFPRSFVGRSAGWLAGWSSYLSTTNPPRQRKEGRNESTKSAQFRHRSTPICQRAEQANASVAATLRAGPDERESNSSSESIILRIARVTAGLAESNGSLPPGL